MKINEQLFEDVLSGKLKGKFVLRNDKKISSDKLHRTKNNLFLYRLNSSSYTETGYFYDDGISCMDIIDFISDVNMKENELTIEIPDNKVVDWDESKKQNKIVLKDKQLTYEDVCKKLFKNKDVFFIQSNGNISHIPYSTIIESGMSICDKNNTLDEHQLECLLAKNKLANVAKYLNDGWKPGKTSSGHFDAWVLFMTPDKNYIGCVKIVNCANNNNVLFKTNELAEQAIEILGEETIKLALEPLGI